MISEVKDELRGTLAWLRITLRPQCVTEVAKAPSEIIARCGAPSQCTALPMVRRSQSMGVHPRLGRGDAAGGLF
jgi:hypothetical protein